MLTVLENPIFNLCRGFLLSTEARMTGVMNMLEGQCKVVTFQRYQGIWVKLQVWY
jgi:hypothetical protein